ncbi:hypothetical protein [Pseudogemmobacter humi]|uniref:Glycosyltransferase n=1 Tax=Pseudogemmobacter humi TaxID=2483812 RepID=A0A3P5XUC3_9RHOB|nr:hypothetical protein [Pseudogemmobacter humi]VDC31658.1 hypothetical protein XINFAN_03032 [Pseudogemmobacter humi]
MDRIVICMKWGTLYGPDYVNVLWSAARENISGPFRFICMTDDATGLAPGIEAMPIPDLGLPPDLWRSGGWPKLAMFLPQIADLSGRALFIDLDMVLWGELDPLFTLPGPLVMLDSGPWRYRNGIPRPMSSIMAFDIGGLPHLATRIIADPRGMAARYQNEQDFIGGEAGEIAFWPQSWIRSYKYHLRPPLLIDRFRGPHPPGPEVKVLCFHGNPRPIDMIRPPKGNWDVPPHYGRGQVSWMVDYWTRHGGHL